MPRRGRWLAAAAGAVVLASGAAGASRALSLRPPADRDGAAKTEATRYVNDWLAGDITDAGRAAPRRVIGSVSQAAATTGAASTVKATAETYMVRVPFLVVASAGEASAQHQDQVTVRVVFNSSGFPVAEGLQ